MQPTPDFLSPYFKSDKKHKFYKESCEYAHEMLTHYDGLKPKKLIEERRPSESWEIQKFRQIIFKSKTKAFCDKITNSLMKIRKSQDFMIKYSNEDSFSISSDETLKSYMEKNFPRSESFTNWYFQIGFKVYQTDTNSLCLWKPINEQLNDNEYYKPYPVIFKSHQVVDYIYSEWYFLLSDEVNVFRENGASHDGKVYYYIDKEGITTLKQISLDGKYSSEEFLHKLGYCPIIDFGGIIQQETITQCLRQSRIYGIVPSFDEAVREYSDLQAEVLQHIHSTMWAHAGQDCKTCKGSGLIPKKDAPSIKCKDCKGKGTVPFNPYEYYEIPRPKAGDTQISGVPIGYVQKQIEIAVLQNTRIKEHIKDGLAAVNMEFLIDPPQINQSGVSKEVDKDDMHTFFHSVAEDIIRFFDKCYSIVIDYRYSGIEKNRAKRQEMMPTIPVPEKYDILSETYLIQEIKMMKDSQVEPEIINSSLIEYVNKKFYADPETQKLVTNILELDPFSSRDEGVIVVQLSNDGVDQLDYVIHCNIRPFVIQAIEEDDTFFTLDLAERKAKMVEYAQKKIDANAAKGKVLSMLNQQDQPTVTRVAIR